MGDYHKFLLTTGQITGPLDLRFDQAFERAQVSFQSPTTERGLPGGCDQFVTAWVRTDVKYTSECESREIDSRNGLLASDQTPAAFRVTRSFVKLPTLGTAEAIALAKARGIPIAPTEKSTGLAAVAISRPGQRTHRDDEVAGHWQRQSAEPEELDTGDRRRRRTNQLDEARRWHR